jgi:hypothetical protein
MGQTINHRLGVRRVGGNWDLRIVIYSLPGNISNQNR